MSTYGSHPEQMTVKLTLGDGAHLVATSANGWAGPVSLVWGPDGGQWAEETSTLTDVGTVDGAEVSWTLTAEQVTARAAFPYVRLVDNGMTLQAGEVIPWTGGLGSTTTQTIASLTAGPPGPSAVSSDAGNLLKLGSDNLLMLDPGDLPAGGGGDTTVQIGTVTLPESPTVGLSVSVLADSTTVLPEGITWDSGGEPTITERMLLVFVWSGEDWVGTYGPSIPAAPVPPDTTAPSVPTGLTATATSHTTIDLEWVASTDAVGVTGYEYRVDAGSAVDAGAGTTETVTGLDPETEYDFEVRAYDEAGNRSDWSSPPVSETTDALPADVTPPTPGTLAESAVTSDSFTLTVTGASDADSGLHATPYRFSLDNGVSWAFDWQSSNVANATGLDPETEYTCVHQVRDAALNVATGASIPVTTSAAGGWTPASLPGLAAWYDASDAATITDAGAGAVSAWNDKSGNGHHLAQPTSALRPVTGSRSLNSLNALYFDGTAVITKASVTTAQPYTLAWVGKYDAIAGTTVAISLMDPGAYGPYSGDGKWRLYNGTTIERASPGSDTNPHVHIGIVNDASSSLRLDGAQIASGSVGTQAGARVNVGHFRSTNLDTPVGFVGIIGEMVLISGVLSGSDLTNLENYLSTKWGTP